MKSGMCLELRYPMFPSNSHTATCELLGYSKSVRESAAIIVRRILVYDSNMSVARTATVLLLRIADILME